MWKILLIGMFFQNSLVLAHEGHDHGPGATPPQKGGVIRSLETVHLELLTKGKKIQVYLFQKDLKPADVTKYIATATVALPRKKAEAIMLKAAGDHWEAEFDAKGAHRYTLEIAITQGGHSDKVKYTVEPKK